MRERNQERNIVSLYRDSSEYAELIRSALHESYKFLRDVLLHRVRLPYFERNSHRVGRRLYQRPLVCGTADD